MNVAEKPSCDTMARMLLSWLGEPVMFDPESGTTHILEAGYTIDPHDDMNNFLGPVVGTVASEEDHTPSRFVENTRYALDPVIAQVPTPLTRADIDSVRSGTVENARKHFNMTKYTFRQETKRLGVKHWSKRGINPTGRRGGAVSTKPPKNDEQGFNTISQPNIFDVFLDMDTTAYENHDGISLQF